MDEQGYALGVLGRSHVITLKKSQYKSVLIQDGKREWTSLIFAIFKAKMSQNHWYDALDNGGTVAVSDKGWTDNELCFEWLFKEFDTTTRQYMGNPEQYRLLIFDGHDSHCINDVIQYSIKNKIIMLCLPAHTTHHLQPLDVGIFGPLSKSYTKAS
jgi:hypothetical protein